ncbi:MAG: pyrroline-5-carboxylate reductase [Clostridiales bacterium]|jgi:pyrroline-5-carboxylate reductase|nr:pyrroline-5-carboxylate reductase [Clostridiales bacterium]
MKSTFAFIGAGNMGGAIIEAVCRSTEPENVTVFDRAAEKTGELSAKTGCRVASNAEEAVKNARFVFLCVKPNVLPEALRGLLPILKEAGLRGDEKVIVSIAAGVTTDTITSILAEANISLPVIRLMPNTPVAVGKGLTLMSPVNNVSDEDIAVIQAALSYGGEVSLIDEAYIDPSTPVFSSSPAYVYMFIEALADGGVMAGVPRDKAQRFAAQAVLGAAAMVLETGRHPGELKDAVCSPGGSTIVGVEELEKNGFRAAVASAVYEAYKKTATLGK